MKKNKGMKKNVINQLKKFDGKGVYIRQWIAEFDLGYGQPMVEHAMARDRAISTYKAGILK